MATNLSRNKKGRFKKIQKRPVVKTVVAEPTTDENNNDISATIDELSDDRINFDGDTAPSITANEPTVSASSHIFIDWKEGRRVVELKVLAENLRRGCYLCHRPLFLDQCVRERHYGLGSLLYINCTMCQETTIIPTGKRHNDNKVWDVNTKLATGMVHAGLGEAGVSKLFATLNIPGMSQKSLKLRERECGPAIEKIAKTSCENATILEKQLSKSETSVDMSYDAGWQTRGSGRAYNSLSGHGAAIGTESGKIISFDVKCKKCRTCEFHLKNKSEPPKHDCRKNWGGSAKAMEPAIAVDICRQLKEIDTNVAKVIMDDDTSTIAWMRAEINPSIEKCSDKNHNKKQFTNELYHISNKNIYDSFKTKTINHLKKCFSYVLEQNKNNVEGIRQGLKTITPHVFGDHDSCSSLWCQFLSKPDTYVPKSLPHQRYLSNENLRQELQSVCDKFSEQAEKLSKLGSTQANESFNQMVSVKCPKNKFYSGSESLSYRVSAAVGQKNEKSDYIVQVNKELGLSPGKFYGKHADRSDRKRERSSRIQGSADAKRRRLHLKEEKSSCKASSETREGTSYCTAISFNCETQHDIQQIPPPIQHPCFRQLENKKYNFVYFDLETTGLGNSDIVQLAAVKDDDSFDRFVVPSCDITKGASKITGITKRGNCIYRHGAPLPAVSLQQCLTDFNVWLKNIPSAVLIGHNCKSFDSKILCKSMLLCPSVSLHVNIAGFIDTLPLFREIVPGRKSYKQESLVTDILVCSYNAHDALDDTKALKQLVQHQQCSIDTLLKHSFSTESALEVYKHQFQTNSNYHTLECLVQNKVVSKTVAMKISSSGLIFNHLHLAFSRNGLQGIADLFAEIVDGHPRVTKSQKIISSVANYFAAS